MWRKIVLFFFCCWNLAVFSQNLRFKKYTQSDGLSQGTVWKIIQDRNGFVWIGTDDGLNRFDGYTFKTMSYEPGSTQSLSGNNVYDILETPDGLIWVATAAGLNCLDPVSGKMEHFKHHSDNKNTLSSDVIKCMAFDSKSLSLWIGAEDGVLNRFDLKTKLVSRFPNPLIPEEDLQKSKIKSVLTDTEGTVWIGTNGAGLYSFNLSGNIFKKFWNSAGDAARVAVNNIINTMLMDSRGRFWIGTDGGHVKLFNPGFNTFIDFGKEEMLDNLKRKGKIKDLLEDHRGVIWAATNQGLTFYEDNGLKFKTYFTANDKNPHSLSSDRLLCLMESANHSIWIGNYEKGFNVLNKTTEDFLHFVKDENNPKSLGSNSVLSFSEDEYGNLLVGTYDGGLFLYDKQTGNFHNYASGNTALKKGILCIHTDSVGYLWLGTWGGGLQRFDRSANEVLTIVKEDNGMPICNNNVLSIYDDGKGCLWLGTFGGLCRFDKKTKKSLAIYTRKEGLSSDVIFYITGKNDSLWIGTKDGGMSIFDIKSQKFENFEFDKDDTSSISNNVVRHILDDNSGSLWVSTERGINIFNKQKRRFRRFTDRDGLPNNNIWAMLKDEKGNFWISTNKGLSRFTPSRAGQLNAFRNFNTNDGLQGDEFNQGAYFKSRSGWIYFGGINGYNAFNPKYIEENTFIPPVHIISFKLFDKEVAMDTSILFKEKIKLKYNQNFISFEFAGLDYSVPEKNLYSFTMENLDKNWSLSSNRRYASYPGLAPGNYVFRVKASNSQGIWNDKGTSFFIEITPPFYKTVWFYLICVVSAIIAVFAFINYRTIRLKREKKVLEDTVALRTRELQQKNMDITASITYAKRLQQALVVPMINDFLRDFKESFVLFRPKDIVSGDFFWYMKKGNLQIFAVVDCTGHGVPGAFMSIIGYNNLEKIINDMNITSPAEILTELNKFVCAALHQRGEKGDTYDGMDMALCVYDPNKQMICYAGAYRPLILIRNKEVVKFKADRFSIGGSQMVGNKVFTEQCIGVEKGDCFYAFTDGYPDQFGGPKNGKFLMSQFLDLLVKVSFSSVYEQDIEIEQTLENWIGDREQIDDILVAGIKF